MSDRVICPECGYMHDDDWPKKEQVSTVRCESCQKQFRLTVEVDVNYETKRIMATENGRKEI